MQRSDSAGRSQAHQPAEHVRNSSASSFISSTIIGQATIGIKERTEARPEELDSLVRVERIAGIRSEVVAAGKVQQIKFGRGYWGGGMRGEGCEMGAGFLQLKSF